MSKYNNRSYKILDLVKNNCKNSEEEFDSGKISGYNTENSNCSGKLILFLIHMYNKMHFKNCFIIYGCFFFNLHN